MDVAGACEEVVTLYSSVLERHLPAFHKIQWLQVHSFLLQVRRKYSNRKLMFYSHKYFGLIHMMASLVKKSKADLLEIPTTMKNRWQERAIYSGAHCSPHTGWQAPCPPLLPSGTQVCASSCSSSITGVISENNGGNGVFSIMHLSQSVWPYFTYSARVKWKHLLPLIFPLSNLFLIKQMLPEAHMWWRGGSLAPTEPQRKRQRGASWEQAESLCWYL